MMIIRKYVFTLKGTRDKRIQYLYANKSIIVVDKLVMFLVVVFLVELTLLYIEYQWISTHPVSKLKPFTL